MEYRTLGKTDLRCSLLGLGTSRLTSLSSNLSLKQAHRLIQFAADCGINFIDTADSYGQGESEIVIGNAIRGNRDKFIVASKVGYRFSHAGQLHFAKRYFKPILLRSKRARDLVAVFRQNARALNMIQQDFSPEYLERAVDDSIHRLGTDYLDILYLHDVPLHAAQLDSIFETLDRIRGLGKVRYFGISTNDYAVLEYSSGRTVVDIVQTSVHPWRPASLWPILTKLKAAGVPVIANQIFDFGTSERNHHPISKYQSALEDWQRRGMSPRQTLIGFAALHPCVSAFLIGTTSCAHLKENLAALELAQKFSMDEIG